MTGLLITLGSLTAYFLAGWRIAMANLPRAWEKARDNDMGGEFTRNSVKLMTACMFLFWPFYLTGIAVSGGLDRIVVSGDPVALQQKLAERDAELARTRVRIAELERELGMRT